MNAKYYVDETGLVRHFYKVGSGQVFRWIHAEGEPTWERVEGSLNSSLPLFFEGSEEGFRAKLAQLDAADQRNAAKDLM